MLCHMAHMALCMVDTPLEVACALLRTLDTDIHPIKAWRHHALARRVGIDFHWLSGPLFSMFGTSSGRSIHIKQPEYLGR